MEIGASLYVTDREEWRAWLAANAATEREIWLIFYRPHTRRPDIANAPAT